MLRTFLNWRIKEGKNTYKYFHRQVWSLFWMPVIFRMTNLELAYVWLSDNLWIPLKWAIKTFDWVLWNEYWRFLTVLSRKDPRSRLCPCKVKLVAIYPFPHALKFAGTVRQCSRIREQHFHDQCHSSAFDDVKPILWTSVFFQSTNAIFFAILYEKNFKGNELFDRNQLSVIICFALFS